MRPLTRQLQEIFSAHGTVESARVITDKFTGRSRGFGFVEMSSNDEAQKAIQALNGTDLDGRSSRLTKPGRKRSGPDSVVIEAAGAREEAAVVDVTAGSLELQF